MGRFARTVAPLRRAWREVRRRGRKAHARVYGPVWPILAIGIAILLAAVVHVITRQVVPGWEWVATGVALLFVVVLLRRPRGTPPKDWGK